MFSPIQRLPLIGIAGLSFLIQYKEICISSSQHRTGVFSCLVQTRIWGAHLPDFPFYFARETKDDSVIRVIET